MIGLLPFLLLACGATKIGTACKSDGDCNVAGQRCVAGPGDGLKICTHTCQAQLGATGCPIGYDCAVSDPGVGLSCNRASYAFDPVTGIPLLFGRSCATDESVCSGTGDPNPNAMCRKGPDASEKPVKPLPNDPNAYCTGTCDADSGCPVSMRCAADYDGVKKCLKRGVCAECTFNDNCPAAFPSCVPTRDGSSKYCTKPCNNGNDCPGAPQNLLWTTCSAATDAAGTAGQFCLHKYGACVGAGEICDPCRTATECTKSASKCYSNDQTGERFCTKQCGSDSDCGGVNQSTCDDSDPNMSTGACTGDKTKSTPGAFSCGGF